MAAEIEAFLNSVGLGRFASAFASRGLTLADLPSLAESDLVALGLDARGDQARFRAAVASLGEHSDGHGGWLAGSDPTAATKEVPFVNCMGMLFVPIPRFKTLFSICQVRVCDYSAYCAAKGLPVPEADFPQGPHHPVVHVSWKDATKFCEWLTGVERKRSTLDVSLSYRLPTDDEWSAAVGLPEEPFGNPVSRSGKAPGYPWGGSFPPPPGSGNYHPLLKADDFPETSPVASFAPNACGIFDLGGNVWELCMDNFDATPAFRTARGASCFNDGEDFLRASYREKMAPDKTRNNVGFRLALSADLLKDPLHRLKQNPWG